MKTVKLRDFQRNFCKLSKEQIAYQVVGAENIIIGTWLPGCTNFVGQFTTSQKEGFESVLGKDLSDNFQNDIVEETLMCDKCKKYESEWYGVVYEEGEDERTVGICDLCYRKFKPRNFKRI